MDEARRFAVEALALYVEDMLKDGEKLPKPLSYQESNELMKKEGAFMFILVPVSIDVG